jgi:hypothetical protein
MLAALSVEHWWGTGESIRNMDSDREASSLYEARRVTGIYYMQTYQQTLPLVLSTSEAGPNEQAAGRVTVQDATDDPTTGRNGITGGSAETMVPPRQDHRQFVYPAWPTSTPGPEATLPPLGQKPYPTRTDQMMYEEPYDQERGRLGVSLPAPMIPVQAAPESRGLTKRAGRLDPFGRMGHA